MRTSKCSIFDLSFDYLKTFYTKNIDIAEKKAIIMSFGTLINRGWVAEEIREHITLFRHSNPGKIMDVNAYFNTLAPKNRNLLNAIQFYYHNEFRITSAPPIVDFDYNTGEVTRTVEDYYLEMRASYTLDDLYQYFLTKSYLYEKATLNTKHLMGSLNWLADQFDLDLLMFMLDTANDMILVNNRRRLRSPMDIKDYFADASEHYQRRLTESKVAEDDKIVPRKRLLFN